MGVHVFWPNDERGFAANQWDHAQSHFKIDSVRDWHDEVPKEHSLVVLSPANAMNVKGTQSLVDFEHPENAVYWFGSNHHHLEWEDLPRQPDAIVYIPANDYTELYSWTALTLVLYDRLVKHG